MKRSVLRNNLTTLREVVNEFTNDHGHPPAALSDLVAGGYLRAIPINPFTGRPDWQVIIENDSSTSLVTKFEVSANKEPQPPVDSTTKAAVVFGVLGILSLAGARICAKLQPRLGTAFLILGLNLVGSISLFSAALVALVIWKGLSRP